MSGSASHLSVFTTLGTFASSFSCSSRFLIKVSTDFFVIRHFISNVLISLSESRFLFCYKKTVDLWSILLIIIGNILNIFYSIDFLTLKSNAADISGVVIIILRYSSSLENWYALIHIYWEHKGWITRRLFSFTNKHH